MISVRLLGPIDVLVDGEPAPPQLRWRKHAALLAYLALAPDRRAGREQLTGLLWGDKPEDAARHSLAEALRLIRRSAADGVEDAGSGYVQLAPDALEADTDLFLARLAAGDPAGAAALVAGELMEGLAVPDAWEFEEWLAGQRRDWRARCEKALLSASEAALDAGAPDDAHAYAARALGLVPTSDAACQAAMKSLCLGGERGPALELYDAFAARLDQDLGILPAEDTDALAERVRQQRAWRLPPGRDLLELRGAESRRAPLVGRSAELAALVEEWAACREGPGCRTVVVRGDAGTGRTRLVEELLARARLDGATAVVVRALPGDRDAEGDVLAALVRPLGIDENLRGHALTDAIRSAAASSPLVLTVDDAAWADASSLAELCALPHRLGAARVMTTFAIARQPAPETLERLVAALGRDVPGAVVTLEPLGAAALRELAAWALPDYDDDALDRVTRRLAADTAGHPLLAVEVLHAVAHGLALEDDAEPWPEPGRTLDHTRPGELPGTLVASVRVGFRVLTPAAQRVLACVAVLDAPVPAHRVAAAAALDQDAAAEALDELEWEHWLVADARGYGFVAPLLREIVARDMVTAGQRQRILERA